MNGRVEFVDFLKGFSITAIVLMHLLEEYNIAKPYSYVVMFGGAGVHAFFLSSGFGLFISQIRKPLSYTEFLHKRLKRVYIPYAIIALIIAIWNIIVLDKQINDTIVHLSSHLLLFKMFFEAYNVSLCPTFWFISTIFQFYLFWPAILWLYNRRRGWIHALLISIAWMALTDKLGGADNRVWGCFFLQYLWEFVLGMKLANMINSTTYTPSIRWNVVVICLLIGIMGMAF